MSAMQRAAAFVDGVDSEHEALLERDLHEHAACVNAGPSTAVANVTRVCQWHGSYGAKSSARSDDQRDGAPSLERPERVVK